MIEHDKRYGTRFSRWVPVRVAIDDFVENFDEMPATAVCNPKEEYLFGGVAVQVITSAWCPKDTIYFVSQRAQEAEL